MFNDRENAVLTTTIFNMPVKKALVWIKENHGYEMSDRTYNRINIAIEANAEKRKRKYILEGVLKKQIQAIDRIEKLIGLSFTNAEACVKSEKYRDAQFVYNSTARLQEILTSYYDEVQDIIEYDTDQEKKMADSRETQSEQDINGFFEPAEGSRNRHFTTN